MSLAMCGSRVQLCHAAVGVTADLFHGGLGDHRSARLSHEPYVCLKSFEVNVEARAFGESSSESAASCADCRVVGVTSNRRGAQHRSNARKAQSISQ
jgi:hypothetical protein